MDNKVILNDQEQARRDKLEKYRELGVDPFGKAYKVTHHVSDIRKLCAKKSSKALDRMNLIVSVAGRIMAIRRMGKASFVNLQDKTGNIQAYIGIDVVGKKSYDVFRLADLGDIVGLKGRVMMTRTGELTIRVEKYTHLTKCLHPLPEKFHGLTDVEERSRRRYLDLIVNDESRKVAFTRPRIVREIQKFLDENDFTEVETSILNPILGGASARPFITHHNTLDKDFYLRIATELNLKRLIVGGMERVYEIGRLFRNEGMDASHNPEFTSIEIYQAYSDLKGIGALTEKMIRRVAKNVTGSAIVNYQGKEIDFVFRPYLRRKFFYFVGYGESFFRYGFRFVVRAVILYPFKHELIRVQKFFQSKVFCDKFVIFFVVNRFVVKKIYCFHRFQFFGKRQQ